MLRRPYDFDRDEVCVPAQVKDENILIFKIHDRPEDPVLECAVCSESYCAFRISLLSMRTTSHLGPRLFMAPAMTLQPRGSRSDAFSPLARR
jgi:hypothetical protein